MNKIMVIIIILMYIWGIVFLLNQKKEGFVSGSCPTTLIKDGAHILIYDPRKARVPGVNPIQMKDLQEYKEYIEWQRASNLKCPILHLEKVYTTQGTEMYEIRQNFLEQPEGGVMHQPPSNCKGDAGLSRPPYNQNQYVGYDKENQTQGNPGVMTLYNR
jgi:hypothetical protein